MTLPHPSSSREAPIDGARAPTCLSRLTSIVWIAVAMCPIALSRADESGTREREMAARKEAERLWTQIVAATKRDPGEFDDDPKQAWVEVFKNADPVFETMKQSPDRKVMLGFFVEQFGKHGPAADLAWYLVQA